MRRGKLFVVSAPSGTGKTTVVRSLVQVVPNLVVSKSYTSRESRSVETDGVDYNFVSRDRFGTMIRQGEFLEWAEVFGNLYGTRAVDSASHLSDGKDLILVIDVQGARQIRDSNLSAIGIFILPPSLKVLKYRLLERSDRQNSEEELSRRLKVAQDEVACYQDYDYVVVNDKVETCVDQIRSIILAERVRQSESRFWADELIEMFKKSGSGGLSNDI